MEFGEAEAGRGRPLSPLPLPVPDGPTQLRALNLTEGSALLHWMAPQNPVDKYNVRVSAPGGEQGWAALWRGLDQDGESGAGMEHRN